MGLCEKGHCKGKKNPAIDGLVSPRCLKNSLPQGLQRIWGRSSGSTAVGSMSARCCHCFIGSFLFQCLDTFRRRCVALQTCAALLSSSTRPCVSQQKGLWKKELGTVQVRGALCSRLCSAGRCECSQRSSSFSASFPGSLL